MKMTQFVNLFVIASALSITGIGCQKSSVPVTQLPPSHSGSANNQSQDAAPFSALDSKANSKSINDISQPGPEKYSGPKDDKIFAAYMVHFEYDSPALKSTEKSKVEYVANYLKANPANGVEVNGHCDERGTDQYNFSLGDRRALSARDELIAMGISADRIMTVSYGRSRPLDPANTDTARAKNRRDQFVLLSQ
jgi:peptidoglycan-associated lipoprotein